MLASRVLPPIVQSSPPFSPAPVATFFNVPRRYVKSNMQVGDNTQESIKASAMPLRNSKKSNRSHDQNDPRAFPTSNPAEFAKNETVPSPTLSSPRVTRKRQSPYMDFIDREDAIDGGSPVDTPQSAMSTESPEYPSHVCLCQPEPKIPRPRNAFILYRQHHQHRVIAENPGLNNPDISKILGERWQSESEERKKDWQDLALKEKARHQEQYPEYRYQPRRIGKSGSSPLNPSAQHITVDRHRCPRCSGRYLRPPLSPSLESPATPTLPVPNNSAGYTTTTHDLPVMSNLSLDSPARRRGRIPAHLANIQVTAAMREDAAMYSPHTPNLTPNKRRRFDCPPPPLSNGRRPDGVQYAVTQHARRESLPPIHVGYSPPNSAGMPHPQTPRDSRKGSAIELVSQTIPSPRTVDEVLSTFPYPNTIRLLGRIIPPYKEPEPSSQIRGAIIAIEGDELASVNELSKWLHESLLKEKEYLSRIVDPPHVPEESDTEVTFEDYLDLIKEWHGKSREMVKFITTPVSSEDGAASEKESEAEDTKRKDSVTPGDSSVPAATTKPVIIIPTFQLHASVTYASRIPIQDAYSPTDHWQWMATMWRGTIGPDLTIYVKTYDAKEGQTGSKPEMDEAVRCLTVCKEKQGKFADADLRRVGFEVSEWIKGMATATPTAAPAAKSA